MATRSFIKPSRAYQEGWDAYEAGVGVPGTVLTNPYPEGTHERDSSDHREHMDWEMGWGDAWDYWNDDPA